MEPRRVDPGGGGPDGHPRVGGEGRQRRTVLQSLRAASQDAQGEQQCQ